MKRLALGLSLMLLITACGDSASTTTTAPASGEDATTTTAVSATTAAPMTATAPDTTEAPAFTAAPGGPGEEWPEEFTPSFMAGCTVDSAEEQCRCMLEEFQSRYAFNDFFSWAFEAEDDPRIVEVAELCTP